jgi:hypothetical protein
MSGSSSKIKTILVLKHRAMKVYAGVEVEFYAFLTLTLNTFIPGSHWREGWMGVTGGVNIVTKEKVSSFVRKHT